MNIKKIFFSQKEILLNGLSIILLTIIMTMAFNFNIFNKNDGGFFLNFQKDSESVVVGKILAEKFNIDTKNSGLEFIAFKEFIYPDNILDSYAIYQQSKSFISDENWINGIARKWTGFYITYSLENENFFKIGSQIVFKNGDTRTITDVKKIGEEYLNIYLIGDILNPKDVGIPLEFKKIENGITIHQFDYHQYKSSYGAQGHLFSFLYNVLGIKHIGLFRLISAFLLAIVLVLICYLLIKPFGFAFSAIFYIVFLFSPWITSFARNLFWIPFIWFLPLLISLLILRNLKNFVYFLPLMFFAIFFKCLCGYEYITTIMLSGISILVISFFSIEKKKDRKKLFFAIIAIGIISLMAFFSALLIHANIKGDSLLKGLTLIWKADVLRRTVGGNPSDFDPVYKDSLEATSFTVIRKYILNWDTDVLYNFKGEAWFPFLFFTTGIIVIYNFIKKQKNYLPELAMYLVFLTTTVSWFFLGKAHSYIHTHMNYVLWYFGFIQCAIYIIIKFFIRTSKNILEYDIELN